MNAVAHRLGLTERTTRRRVRLPATAST